MTPRSKRFVDDIARGLTSTYSPMLRFGSGPAPQPGTHYQQCTVTRPGYLVWLIAPRFTTFADSRHRVDKSGLVAISEEHAPVLRSFYDMIQPNGVSWEKKIRLAKETYWGDLKDVITNLDEDFKLITAGSKGWRLEDAHVLSFMITGYLGTARTGFSFKDHETERLVDAARTTLYHYTRN